MKKIALISRSTLYDVPGGDTIQMQQTARHLAAWGYDATIHRTTDTLDYDRYQLFHFFNLTRPADILYHLDHIRKPIVLTPILIDYSEYDRHHRTDTAGKLLRNIPESMTEYGKTVARWLRGKDAMRSMSYLWKGQQRSIRQVLSQTGMLLPNAEGEKRTIESTYGYAGPSAVIPNGIEPELFRPTADTKKDPFLVICAARIEGIKNQLQLIRALNNTQFRLILIGKASPNQQDYYEACRKEAGQNISFVEHLPQQELVKYFARATVHALPSWFETCGLSSLEAAAMGCRPVISDRGYTRDYFGEAGFYCDPGDSASILSAVERAAAVDGTASLQQKIKTEYTWQQAVEKTAAAYSKITTT